MKLSCSVGSRAFCPGSDLPPYKSPRGSDYDESSAESDIEDGSYGDGYGDLWDEHE